MLAFVAVIAALVLIVAVVIFIARLNSGESASQVAADNRTAEEAGRRLSSL